MKYIVCNSENAVYNRVYDELEKYIEEGAVFSFSEKIVSTQFTKRIIDEHKAGKYKYNHIIFIGQKELAGSNKEETNGFYRLMRNNLYTELGVEYNNIYYPTYAEENDLKKYEDILDENPIDVALIFIDRDGYILNDKHVTNENKGVHLTKIKDADSKTWKDNYGIKAGQNALVSIGYDNVMSARNIFLIALGEDKREYVADIFADSEDSSVISLLKKHPNLAVFVNKEAGFKSEEEVNRIIRDKQKKEQIRQRRLAEESKTENKA